MNTLTKSLTASHVDPAQLRTGDSSGLSVHGDSKTQLKGIELVSIWAFWGFIAVLTFINALINEGDSPVRLPATAPLVAALADSLIWAILTPMIFRLTSRYNLEHPKWFISLFLMLVLGLLLSTCAAKLVAYVRYEQAMYYFQHGQIAATAPVSSFPVTGRFWIMNDFVVYLIALAGGYAHDYFSRYRTRHEQASVLQAQAADLRAELANSRLHALRSQLNPHFLFNTLNAVSSLVEVNPKGANRMIACLSDLLRDTLDETELEVPLEQELKFIRRYIDIMQTRFTGRLVITEAISPDTLNAKVPKLLLQPLVENAIKHGIAKIDGIGKIHITAEHSADRLILRIKDNGSAEPSARIQEEQEGFGLGLKNTQARLLQSYGNNQSLTLSAEQGGGVVAMITLPYHTASHR